MSLSRPSLTIRKVLIGTMAVVLVSGVLVEAWRFVLLRRAWGELELVSTNARALQESAGEMKYIATDLQRLAVVGILTGEKALAREAPDRANHFYDLAAWVCFREQDEDPGLCDDVRALKQRFGGYVEELVAAVGVGGLEQGRRMRQLARVETAYRSIISEIEAVSREISIRSRRQIETLRVRTRRHYYLTILLLSSLPLVFGLVIWFLEKNLTRPVKEMMRFFRRQAEEERDLRQRLEIDCRGEIGELAFGLNRLLDTLEQTTVSRDRLQEEVAERRKIEESLRELKGRLEHLVTERTGELRAEVEQRKRAEDELLRTTERLQESLEYVHSIVENLPVCVKLVDNKGRLLDINPAGLAMLGVDDLEAVRGKEIYPLVADEDRDAYIRFNEMVCAGARGELEFSIRRQDGEIRRMFTLAVPMVHHDSGEVVQLGISRDLTRARQAEEEQKQLRDQLRQVQQLEAIATLAGGIAHDFNNILTGIMGFAELAALDAEEDSRQARDIQEIINAGNRARELVRQLLSVSRREDHEFSPHRVHVIIKEGVKLLRSSLPATIDIRQQICTDCPPVFTDPTQIHQVLMNLATNAYHAMGDHGVLEVNLHCLDLPEGALEGDNPSLPPGKYVVLEVRDSGCGMDALTVKRIFEPYFTTKNMEKGAGLGLSTVHGIVRAHEGEITVASTPGEGSVFRVYLPAMVEQPVAEIGQAAPGGCERILLVDDEEANLEMTQRLLTRLGYEVTICKSSREALEIFGKTPQDFDLVMTDFSMPEMNGEELARALTAVRAEIPIVLCSGFSNVMDDDRAREAGIRDYLMKPFTSRDLAAAIRRALDG